MNKKIVVTGGSGMVGQFLKEIMSEAVYLSSSDYDLTDEEAVIEMYKKHRPHTVIHLAAKVGGIVDNINKPAEYFTDNILMNTLLIKWAKLYDVKRFMGILSTCIYPNVVPEYPMKEEDLHLGPPTPTNFSYGYAKRCLAVQIDACNKQYETKYSYLTPCNLYGEYDKYGESSHFVAALIGKIIKAKKENQDHIHLFGSGKPLRQFMHAGDLAKIIKYCIYNDIHENFNIANQENFSINQIAEFALEACDAKGLKIIYDAGKVDGQFRKDVSIEKMESIIPNFKFTTLHDGIKKTYKFLINSNFEI